MQYYYIQYYLAIKRDDTLPFVTTWIDFEGLMLSEISQKDKYNMISLICRLTKKTAYRYGEQTGDCQMWGSVGGRNGPQSQKIKRIKKIKTKSLTSKSK